MEDLARVRKVTTAGVAGSTVGLDVEELKRVLVGLEHHAAVLLNSDLELAVRTALALRVKQNDSSYHSIDVASVRVSDSSSTTTVLTMQSARFKHQQ